MNNITLEGLVVSISYKKCELYTSTGLEEVDIMARRGIEEELVTIKGNTNFGGVTFNVNLERPLSTQISGDKQLTSTNDFPIIVNLRYIIKKVVELKAYGDLLSNMKIQSEINEIQNKRLECEENFKMALYTLGITVEPNFSISLCPENNIQYNIY